MRLTIIPGGDTYRYLWLKSIRGVDLTQHCATVFIGPYHPDVDAKAPDSQTIEFEPDPDAIAYYLCGVTSHPKWYARNAHLAFVPTPDGSWCGTAGDVDSDSHRTLLHADLVGAEPVFGWGPHSIPDTDPNRHRKGYATCRNYQFAHHLAAVRGLASQANPAAFNRRRPRR